MALNGRHEEMEILQQAVQKLRKTTGLTVEVQPPEPDAPHRPDALIRVVWRDKGWRFAAEVKEVLTAAMIGLAAQKGQRFPNRTLLIARHVAPKVAEQLKEMNTPFLDAAGNSFINEPPLYIFIKGNKLTDKHRQRPATRAFRPAGLQVVFALLCNPGLENAPFRQIARTATVALGTAELVMHDLKRTGYLIDMKARGRRLTKKEDLLARWITAYPEQLRPKKLIGRYRAKDPDWWKRTNIQDFNAYWGGEVAANVLTNYLKPQVVTIYTDQPVGKLVLKNKLTKHTDGDIEMLKTFWELQNHAGAPDLVHPLLIYADLVASGDARNIETGKIIYDKELTRLIRED